jgi:hypothetical protein
MRGGVQLPRLLYERLAFFAVGKFLGFVLGVLGLPIKLLLSG